jgi:hypothetical protein
MPHAPASITRRRCGCLFPLTTEIPPGCRPDGRGDPARPFTARNLG